MPVLTDVRESMPLPVGDGEPTLPAEVLTCPLSNRSSGGERPLGRAREAAPACEGTTVLVAEDHAPTVRDLVLLAEARGHPVIAVADGARAWSVLRRRRVSLVIVGRAIPGLDGLELCRRIRARRADHYTYIVLTGEGGDGHRLEGLHAGADDFLARPLDLREMTARLVIARRILATQEGLARKNAELARLAETDPLTGLCNRRRFDEALRMHASLANRRGLPLALAMLDVDHFKAYNDAFGHPAGDGVLRGIARLLRDEARAHDVLARYGGEEFAALLPATDATAAQSFAERLRAAIEAADWPLRPITASFGVATLDPVAPDPSALVRMADAALYRSKRLGRNRVTPFDDSAVTPKNATPRGI
jgi:diguanylate cyclase (GGDEF)-like protein